MSCCGRAFVLIVIACIAASSWGFSVRPLSARITMPLSTRQTMPVLRMSMTVNPPKIIIAGAPAAGKGTQCEVIKDELGVVHLSTGDILRAAVKEGTPLGIKAKEFMDAGKLVPDDLIINVVCERLKQPDCQSSGWLLDGFPRTKSQAEALSAAGNEPDKFILLDVPEEVLVERVTGRRTDPVTGKIYHMKFNPPENDEVAGRLVQRSDDTAEKIVVRYKEFQGAIDDVRASYEDKLDTIDGTKSQPEVSQYIIEALRRMEMQKETQKEMQKSEPTAAIIPEEKPKPNVPMTVGGLGFLFAYDRLFAKAFQKAGINFPSALGGMVTIFFALTGLSVVNKELADKIEDKLSHSVSFIKSTLLLYFSPSLVVLPTKWSLISQQAGKMIGLVVAGVFASLTSSGLFAKTVSHIESKNKVPSDSADSPVSAPPAVPLPPLTTLLIASAILLDGTRLGRGKTMKMVATKGYGVMSTLACFAAAGKLPANVKSVLHPVACTAGLTAGFQALYAKSAGVSWHSALSAYYGSGLMNGGDLIAMMLGPAVVSFGIQLFQYRAILAKNALSMLIVPFFGALFGISSSLALSTAFKLTPHNVFLAPVTRSITTPLGIAGAKLIGSDVPIATLMVVATGILGASVGKTFLNKIGVKDDISVGLSLGASAHGIGAASLVKEPVAFAIAIVSMTLTGLWTICLLALAQPKLALL